MARARGRLLGGRAPGSARSAKLGGAASARGVSRDPKPAVQRALDRLSTVVQTRPRAVGDKTAAPRATSGATALVDWPGVPSEL